MIRPENRLPPTNHPENPILTARVTDTPPKPDTAPVKNSSDTSTVPKEKIQNLLSILPSTSSEKSLAEKLKSSGLSPENILDTLSYLMDSADADSTRLRAAETALKVHGLLTQNASPVVPTVVINISGSRSEGTNPILLPRELTQEKISKEIKT